MSRGLRIVVDREHDVGNVAAVSPIAQTAGRHHTRRAHGSQHVVDAREEMDEEIARYAGSVVAIVAPAEEPYGIERPLGRVADEPVPIDGRRRGIGRYRILPGA